MDDGRWTIDDRRWTMDDGRWTMDDGRWTMDDGRWTMDDGRWTMGISRMLSLPHRPSSIVHRLFTSPTSSISPSAGAQGGWARRARPRYTWRPCRPSRVTPSWARAGRPPRGHIPAPGTCRGTG